jgi:hypothetical protein
MLLIVIFFFVKIDLFSCIFENKTEQDLFNEINHERKKLGLEYLQIHLTLQLAAQKRCANQQELFQSYEKMISNTYRNDEWPKQEQLNQIFPNIGEIIYLNGINIRDEIFHNSFFIPNIYRRNFVYIGINRHEYKNFSARCILYGSSNNSISNHHRLLRLLYILIGCGILLLSLIICSMLNDRRRMKLKQQLEENKQSIIPIRRSSSKRGDMTMARLGSMIDERPSAVHSFFQSPK